jgi:hypothetical protein
VRQPRIYPGRIPGRAVDTEADQENIKVLYANLKTTSAQIDVSA